MHNENILNENELENVTGGTFNAILERDSLSGTIYGSAADQIVENGFMDILKKI